MIRIAASCLLLVLAGQTMAQSQPQQQPPQSQGQQRPAQRDVDPNAMVVLALQAAQSIEANRAGDVWERGSPVFKRSISKDAFAKQTSEAFTKMGRPQARAWLSVVRQSINAPDTGAAAQGAPPPGTYVSVRFAVQFQGGQIGTELVTYRQESPDRWLLAGYVLQ